MKKLYACRFSGTNILVKINGVVKRVEFEADVIGDFGLRGSTFITENATLQSAIENHPRYKSGLRDEIWCVNEPKVEVKEEAAPVIDEPKRVKRIKKKEE